jgi:hypothetical protein
MDRSEVPLLRIVGELLRQRCQPPVGAHHCFV